MKSYRSFTDKFVEALVEFHKAETPSEQQVKDLQQACRDLNEYALEYARYLTDIISYVAAHDEQISQDTLSMSVDAVGELINIGQTASEHWPADPVKQEAHNEQ